MLAYQLQSENGFVGYYIWTNEEDCREICAQMNKDREKMGLEPELFVSTVEII